jgi:hypothetical protein
MWTMLQRIHPFCLPAGLLLLALPTHPSAAITTELLLLLLHLLARMMDPAWPTWKWSSSPGVQTSVSSPTLHAWMLILAGGS